MVTGPAEQFLVYLDQIRVGRFSGRLPKVDNIALFYQHPHIKYIDKSLGFPGGPRIQKTAESGDPAAVKFPRAWLEPDSLDVSFSGLKTAVRNEVLARGGSAALDDAARADIAASFQEAVVEVLTAKTVRAAESAGVRTVVVAGGVAANGPLRARMEAACAERGWSFAVPELRYCGDNAAMVALAASLRLARGERSSWDLPAVPTLLQSTFGEAAAPA